MTPAKIRTDVNTFSTTGSVTRLSDWPLSDALVRERARCSCPAEVFEREYDHLVKALTLVAGKRETAADAVQEAFVRLVRDWPRISGYEDPGAWVRRVAVNLVRDQSRSMWRQTRLMLRMEQERTVPEEVESLDPQLWELVRTLPTKQRIAVALHYVGDFTARQVADAMHISEGAVDQHLHRALRTLREELEDRR